jgi:hypothetical protein
MFALKIIYIYRAKSPKTRSPDYLKYYTFTLQLIYRVLARGEQINILEPVKEAVMTLLVPDVNEKPAKKTITFFLHPIPPPPLSRTTSYFYMHCNENPLYVFLFWELRGLSPNFHIPVSVSDFYSLFL